jgi:hypothetical protein
MVLLSSPLSASPARSQEVPSRIQGSEEGERLWLVSCEYISEKSVSASFPQD